jgi:peptide/nickel transport system permease protein
LALAAPVLFPSGPFKAVDKPLLAPLQTVVLGTDVLGRDVAAGIAYGARTSLSVALIATLIAALFGTLIGSFAGYFGGSVDGILTPLTEFFQAIPSFLLAIVLIAILTPSIESIVISIAAVSWPSIARLVRGEYLRVRSLQFVQAAVGIGMRSWQIMLKEILPNCLPTIIVAASLMIANAILIESALSFLGLGDPNMISWGFMISAGRSFLRTAWWLCAIPGLALLVTALAINLVAEGLADAFNPRLRDV